MRRALLAFAFVLSQIGFSDDGYHRLWEKDLATTLAGSAVFQNIADNPASFPTVESVLAWFTGNVPSQLEHFTLMHTSLSLQGASYLAPRAITFGSDGRLLMTFNGESTQPRYHSLESFEYLPPDAEGETRYRSREIHFEQGLPIVVTDSAVCRRCHEAEVRPIWNPYEVWDGAYGKRDDALIDYVGDKYAPPHSEEIVAEGKQDFENFLAFRKVAPQHSRYQFLRFPGKPEFWIRQYPDKEYVVAPYGATTRFMDYRYRPNLRLTGLLAAQNAQRLSRRIRRDSACYQRYGKILLANLLGCGDMEKYQPKMTAFIAEADVKVTALYEKYDVKSWSRYGSPSSLSSRSALFLILLGVDKNDFNLSLNPSVWNYFEGSDYMDELLLRELYPQIGEELKKLRPIVSYNTYGTAVTLGKELTKAGENDFTDRAQACEVVLDEISEDGPHEGLCEMTAPHLTENVTGMCLTCHDGAEPLAPIIPFRDAEAMKTTSWKKKILKRIDSADPKLRMPPTRRLSVHEKRALRQYLQ